MKTFFSFVQEFLYESKYAVSKEDARGVLSDKNSKWESKVWAGRHATKENGFSDAEIGDHVKEMFAGNRHMKVAAIKHPHAEEHLTAEEIDSLKNHKDSLISNAANKRWGSGAASVAAPKQPKQETQKKEPVQRKKLPSSNFDFGLGNVMSSPKHKTASSFSPFGAKSTKATPVEQKPLAKKKSSSEPQKLSIEEGDPEKFGMDKEGTKVTHVKRGSKIVGTVVSKVLPGFGELDKDKVSHKAYSGDPDSEEGMKPINHANGGAEHESHQHAILAAVNHIKSKK